MSFRKRNTPVSSAVPSGPPAASSPSSTTSLIPTRPLPDPSVRPSTIDGRPVTSTGAASLDGLLGGHGGIALGHSILLEETGTTDYTGLLLRYYAAEGVVQGHDVIVVGMNEAWGRELPGLAKVQEGFKEGHEEEKEKMKIAWRYEGLGEFQGSALTSRVPMSSRTPTSVSKYSSQTPFPIQPYTHTFDLTTRLTSPSPSSITYIPVSINDIDPFEKITSNLKRHLKSDSRTPVRIAIPALLSPAIYPASSAQPHHLLPFLHSLRSLLRQHHQVLTAMLSLPLTLHPRSSGLVRWAEIVSDGVLELTPFAHDVVISAPPSTPGSKAAEEHPQGLVRVHKIPVVSERSGVGGSENGDWAFTVSRRRFAIKEWSLPPVEGEEGEEGGTKVNIEF